MNKDLSFQSVGEENFVNSLSQIIKQPFTPLKEVNHEKNKSFIPFIDMGNVLFADHEQSTTIEKKIVSPRS